MKTKLITLTLVVIAAMATSCGTSKKAMQSSGVDKSAKEYIAEQVAEWKADGYKRSGASVTYSLEELMARHRSKMETSPDKYFELYGVANSGAKSSLSALKMMALNDAAREYATKADMSMNNVVNAAKAEFKSVNFAAVSATSKDTSSLNNLFVSTLKQKGVKL